MPLISSVADTAIFDPELLQTDSAIESALAELRAKATDVAIDSLIDDLLSQPSLLEFIISATDYQWPIASRIIENFPVTPQGFIGSTSAKVLSQISLYMLFLRFSFPEEIDGRLKQYRRIVEYAPHALHEILSIKFTGENSVNPIAGDIRHDDVFLAQTYRSSRQVNRPQANVDPKPFQYLGLCIPNTRHDAEKLSRDILQDQKRILQFYFSMLRQPELSEVIKLAYIPSDTSIKDGPRKEIQESSPGLASLNGSEEEENLSVYPMVLPMKAALYFDSAKGMGDWRILISTRADKNLRETRRRDAQTFRIMLKKMKELSNGHFSTDNHKRLSGSKSEIPIYEAKLTSDLRLVYQIDCIPDDNINLERQVVKIFGFYTHAQLDNRFWKSMSYQLSAKGKEYTKRCNFRNRTHQSRNSTVLPMLFPQGMDPTSSDPPLNQLELPCKDPDEIQSLLVLEKFVTVSQALLYSIFAEQDVQHVFQVTHQEKEIIEHEHSCYVLGRSGTGKTTTMVFKMLGIERAWQLDTDHLPKPRQLFVTKSSILAGKVEEYFSKLMKSFATASLSTEELQKLAKSDRSQENEARLISKEDEMNWENILPARFSLLKDEHFPLFISFDHLCKLLEGDIVEDGENRCATEDLKKQNPLPNGSFVSYPAFKASYWPHFNQALTKRIDPLLAFSEFLGVIEGSEEALTHQDGVLDKEAYANLSHRSKSNFNFMRDTIYTVFQSYVKKKRECGDYDAADRTRNILTNIQRTGISGRKIDYLYVDEAQDNLLMDALLMRSICKNPNGLFWAGDSAQTISAGSSFRFNDLKAFLYRLEQNRHRRYPYIDSIGTTREEPRMFHLSVNYRSHSGIVNCAHSVIRLITELWPDAIDILAQEKGTVHGSKPIFFSWGDHGEVAYEQFFTSKVGSNVDFGAEQCILVRDEVAREKLRKKVGQTFGIIMTLYESKGLEFNDVLLYNFFQDSSANLSQWRVVLNMLETSSVKAPHLDDLYHASVCSELKFLYVAITRAKKNVWIFDCSEQSEPMRVFWTTQNLVQNHTPDMDIPSLAVPSSKEEWAMQGNRLFQKEKYAQAVECFEKASMQHEVLVADAYRLREEARTAPTGSVRRSRAFTVSADAFVQCAISESAVREKRAYSRTAAECYESCGKYSQAARSYLDAEEFTIAAELYRKNGMFDNAVHVVNRHRGRMQADVILRVIHAAGLFYLKENKLSQALELFSNAEDALKFTETHMDDGSSKRHATSLILLWLWHNLPFGKKQISSKAHTEAQSFLEAAAQLDVAFWKPNDRDEICMFRAILSGDSVKLVKLGEKFFLSHTNPAAGLRSLDYVFVVPPQIYDMNVYEAATTLKAYQFYVDLLAKMVAVSDPCNNSSIQKLFLFQRSTNRYFLVDHRSRLLFSRVQGTVAASTNERGAVRVHKEELTQIIKKDLRERLRETVLQEDEICREASVFLPQCLSLTVTGSCETLGCPQAHPDSAKLNGHSRKNQIKLHLRQIQILNILHFSDRGLDPELKMKHRSFWLSKLYDVLNADPAYLANSLAFNSPREFTGACAWARHMLYTMDTSKPQESLTMIMKAAHILFSFDRMAACSDIKYSPCWESYTHLQVTPPQDRSVHVVELLLKSLSRADGQWRSTGLLYIRRVVYDKLPVDASALCDFIEFICSSLIFSMRSKDPSILHGVTLPRSWLLRLSKVFEEVDDRDTQLIPVMLSPLVKLLEQIYSNLDADHLLFDRQDLVVRDVLILRLCRSLCLLGYNTPASEFRMEILRSITTLRKDNRPHSSMLQPYFRAEVWNDLVSAVHRSTHASDVDELIQLIHESGTSNPERLHPTRLLFFRDIWDVPRLLASLSPSPSILVKRPKYKHPSQLDNIRKGPEAPMTINESENRAESDVMNSTEDTRTQGEEDVLEESEHDVHFVGSLATTEALTNSVDGTPAPNLKFTPSKETLDAARVIVLACRNFLSRRRSAESSFTNDRARFFTAFWMEAKEMEWSRGDRYGMIYLGPISHLLFCLEEIQRHAKSTKDALKKRFQTAENQELEEVGKLQTEVNGLIKDVKRLQSLLGPKVVYHNRDIGILKRSVMEVQTLVQRLPSRDRTRLQADLDLAVKGVITEAKPLGKKE